MLILYNYLDTLCRQIAVVLKPCDLNMKELYWLIKKLINMYTVPRKFKTVGMEKPSYIRRNCKKSKKYRL